ncbi:MAG: hypothetical protein PHD95_04550 [Candidatus ainarchaeum sp.]|nr:hypothetical protein [Candidatus ainarchaeum sp.]
MPTPKRRRFEIRQRQKRRQKISSGIIFKRRLKELLSRIKIKRGTRPIHVLFVCFHGIAASGLMQEGLKMLLEKFDMQHYFDIARGRCTFSDVFHLKSVDYIVFLPKNVTKDTVKMQLTRVDPNSKAKIVEFPLLPNTGILDEINYKNLVIKLLEKELQGSN